MSTGEIIVFWCRCDWCALCGWDIGLQALSRIQLASQLTHPHEERRLAGVAGTDDQDRLPLRAQHFPESIRCRARKVGQQVLRQGVRNQSVVRMTYVGGGRPRRGGGL